MEADLEDSGFMDGMKNLLGMEPEAVETFLDDLDNDSLLALTDAVAKGDKDAATAIVKSFDVHVNSLFRGDDIDEKPEKKTPVKPPSDHVFAIGDDVAIKTKKEVDEDDEEDTGQADFVSATVFQPNAPGDTIGVKIKGRPKMVEKDEVYTLNEMGVMGMVGIPDIQRMQQLAGIGGGAVTQTPVVEQPMAFDNQSDFLSRAVCALDQLESALPNIRLGDLKMIRQRITAVQTKMNESIIAMPAGRAKK
jgi:hypothetical protein